MHRLYSESCYANLLFISLPAVKGKLQERLYDVVHKLQRLPELPPNPELEIRKGLLEFTSLARTCLEGQEFLDAWKAKELDFCNAILDMKPKYIVKPPVSTVIDLDSDCAGYGSTPNQSKRPSIADHYLDVQATPSKRRIFGTPSSAVKGEDFPTSSPRGMRASVAPITTPSGLRPPGFPPRSRSLEQLRAIIESKRKPGVPNSVPDGVYEFLCREAVQPWGLPVNTLLRETTRLVNAELHKALGNAFSLLKKRSVFREAKSYLDDFLKAHRVSLAARLGYAHNLERRRMYTRNESFFTVNQESELRDLTRHRHFYRWAAVTGQQPAPGSGERQRPKLWKDMTEEERQQEQARMAKEAPKLGRDPYQQELLVAAYARGYYLTAASRFIDYVSLHILSGMFPAIAESIQHHLDQKLGLMDQAGKLSAHWIPVAHPILMNI